MALLFVRGPCATCLGIPLIANDLSDAATYLLRADNVSWDPSKGSYIPNAEAYRGKVV